jgi:hypothetical protein
LVADAILRDGFFTDCLAIVVVTEHNAARAPEIVLSVLMIASLNVGRWKPRAQPLPGSTHRLSLPVHEGSFGHSVRPAAVDWTKGLSARYAAPASGSQGWITNCATNYAYAAGASQVAARSICPAASVVFPMKSSVKNRFRGE